MDSCGNSSTISTSSPSSEKWDDFSSDIESPLFLRTRARSILNIEREFYYDTEVIVIGMSPIYNILLLFFFL